MPLDPLEIRPRSQTRPLIHLPQNVFHQVAILHRLARRCLPPVLPPVDTPRRETVDRVPAVGDDGDVSVFGDGIKGSHDGC